MRRASVTFFRKLAAATGAAESKPRTEQLTRLRPFSSSYEKPRESTEKKLKKESSVLEKFRQRKLQGSQLKNSLQKSSSGDLGIENRGHGAAEVVTSGFAELGLKEELISAAEEMGVRVPDEIQCVGIPAILEGKSVVLSCEDGDGGGRTLAYLLPLIQLLRQNEMVRPNSKKHPKAVVLCPTEDIADEVFRGAKFVCDLVTRTRPEVAEVLIGLLVGTPEEILQQMENKTIVVDDIKHLVLDEADTMLELGYSDQISKIIRPLRNSKSTIQTILASSPITKMLSEDYSPLMNRIERENAGQVAAMLLEMDQEEAFDVVESPGALKRKVAEAMVSLSSEEANKP